jgi:hypothetical protein
MTNLEVARRQEVRWQILQVLDSQRPEWISLELFARWFAQKGLELSATELAKELNYLQDKELVVSHQSGRGYRLSALGTSVVEGVIPAPPGVTPSANSVGELERTRRQEIRWRVLRAVDVGRPNPVNEHIIWRSLEDIQLLVTTAEFRREVLHLIDLGLVSVRDESKPTWLLDLTALGVDVVEYTSDVPPGIARPEKYW